MEFRFENIGPIKSADLELGDLTIVAGHNNTGKTYIAYALYGFLSTIDKQLDSEWSRKFVQEHFDRIGQGAAEDIIQKTLKEGQFEWSLDNRTLQDERDRLVARMAEEYSETGLYQTFKAPPPQFQDSSFRVTKHSPVLLTYSSVVPIEESALVSFAREDEKVVVRLRRMSEEQVKKISFDLFERRLVHVYLRFLLGTTFLFAQNPHIFPSARNSIALFLHDLDYINNQVTFSLRFSPGRTRSARLLDLVQSERLANYPLPVHDSIDFHRSVLYSADAPNEDLDSLNKEPFESFLGGKYRVVENSLRFTSLEEDETPFDVPIHNASSSVQELVGLSFFLRDLDIDGSRLIIIDEPESQLDTNNQIQLARLLVTLVNAGQQVLITTHSDYIVKEINNLIMLDSDFERKEEVSKRLGYKPQDKLSPDQVRAYIAERGALRPCKVRSTGIEMDIFDDTIKSINMTARELFMLIKDEREKNNEV